MKSLSDRLMGLTSLFIMLIPCFALTAAAGEYELTPRLNIVGSSGKPTNDVLGIGIALHRRLSDEWYLGINLDHSPEFDFEEPSNLLRIQSAEVADAVGSMTMITVVGERRYPQSDDWTLFWHLGGGFAEVDMDNVGGDVAGGGTYDIATDVDTEFILIASVGWLQSLRKNWSARYEITAESHNGGWDVRDEISGNEGKIDEYGVYGLRLGMTYHFD